MTNSTRQFVCVCTFDSHIRNEVGNIAHLFLHPSTRTLWPIDYTLGLPIPVPTINSSHTIMWREGMFRIESSQSFKSRCTFYSTPIVRNGNNMIAIEVSS